MGSLLPEENPEPSRRRAVADASGFLACTLFNMCWLPDSAVSQHDSDCMKMQISGFQTKMVIITWLRIPGIGQEDSGNNWIT